MGIDWTFGGQGHGYALPWNRMVLSGDSEFGVANVHELVHYVLAPLLQRRRTHRIIGEGIATWVGGSIGRTFDELRREYAVFLAGHPDVTLDAVLAAEGADIGFYPAGAMLVDMVHERSGLEGVKQLLESGRSDAELKDALVTLLDAPWTETAASWRERFTRVLETGR